MQTPLKRNIEKIRSKDRVKTDVSITTRKSEDEKLTKATPRNYLQTTTTADIYARKKAEVQAPKKAFSSTLNTAKNVSPMKDYLKTTSTVSVRKNTKMAAEKKLETKVNLHSARTPRIVKAQAPANVTVNSPVLKRSVDLKKSNLSTDRHNVSNAANKVGDVNSNMADIFFRQRSKTRTLDENEVKVLKADVVDNNAEMRNLSKRLSAKPKAFFVDLKGEEAKIEKEKSSEDEVSYEDDFESYESDFDSYHSESHSDGNSATDEDAKSHNSETGIYIATKEINVKDNEEKMLDSGSFDLRDPQRSAQKKTPLDLIDEVPENFDKRISLTDEGFQDMSTSSVSSMKVVHVDVLDRPLFIDFAVSKRNRKKRRIFQQLEQRAKDILSMVTLHEMTYTLFEMQPIPYDLYMATFGGRNSMQVAVQTFDDGITEEVQTEEVIYQSKWTQHPIEFSKYIPEKEKVIKRNTSNDLINKYSLLHEDKNIYDNVAYNSNQLRIFLEQKDGVGPDVILPHEIYISKLKDTNFNVKRLNKFLKKTESRISNILSLNAGNTDIFNLTKSTKFPFSTGYITINTQNNTNCIFNKNLKVRNVIFSTNKGNLLITVHEKCKELQKCILCLWDLSGVLKEPIKFLIAPDNVSIGQFRGGADGIIVAALEDGSINLWDLSEKATWINVTSDEISTNSVEIDTNGMTQTEIDREWNLNNSKNKQNEKISRPMQTSAYTNSGVNIIEEGVNDCIVALEFIGESSMTGKDDGRKIIAQICSLQRIGILTVYSIVQERSRKKCNDIGKAFWSKLALEKTQTIHLTDYLDVQNVEIDNINKTFNLNSAKRRISNKRLETKLTTHQSADRRSVASGNKTKNKSNIWETGILCYDMKILRIDNIDNFLIAKNCGEVLRCVRFTGIFKVYRLCVANDTCCITCLEISQNALPVMLAGTDSGTVNLCSIKDFRVLLTLDCGNINFTATEKYKTDSKGRYISSAQTDDTDLNYILKETKMSIKSLVWPQSNPFDIVAVLSEGAVVAWRLTNSDIAPTKVTNGNYIVANGHTMALVTQNEVHVYRISSDKREDNLQLFQRYLTLL